MNPEIENRIISSNIRYLVKEIENICAISRDYVKKNPKSEFVKSICKRLESNKTELLLYQDIDKVELISLNIYDSVIDDFKNLNQTRKIERKSIRCSYVDDNGGRTEITSVNKDQY